MDERRLTRKDPITVWVPSIDANVEVKPLPWRVRNDLGNKVDSEFRRALVEAKDKNGGDVFSYVNYDEFLLLQFPGIDLSQITFQELMPLLAVMCEVNGLESVLWMLDPEVSAPNSQMEEGAEPDDGTKMSSTLDSSPVASLLTELKN